MIRAFLLTLAIFLAVVGRGAAQDAPAGAASPPADAAPAAAAPASGTASPEVTPPKPSATPPQPAPKAPEHLESTQSILGTQVLGEDGNSIGRLVDVFVDKAGVPRAALLDIGGFLGVGSRRIVVPWQTLHFKPDSKDQTIAIVMTSDQLKAAPEYKGARPPPAAPPSTPAPAAAPAQSPPSPSPASASPPPAPPPAAPATPPAPPAPPASAGSSQEAPARPAPPAPAPDGKPAAPSQ